LPDLQQKLQARGRKVTPQRRLILDILRDSELHVLTAEEIVNQARRQQPNISAGTVYRNLNTLCDLELLKRLDSVGDGRRYELNTGHHHHLFCLGCRDTIAIDFCPMSDEVRHLSEQNGFEIADHSFEIKGYCSRCREEEGRWP
jgi:Fur family ferric uptake transcriptional regulator